MLPSRLLLLEGKKRFFDGRTDVAAAYSLLRLRSAYVGALIRVRRSSDNAELDFGDSRGNVDWGAVSSFIGAGSGFVSKWYDQSGLGLDAAQTTASSQPAIGLLANGLPGLTFDGVNDFLITSAFSLAFPFSFAMCMRSVTANQAGIENFWSSSSTDCTFYASNGASTASLFAGTQFLSDTTSMPVGTRGVVGGVMNGASSRIDINSTAITSVSGNANTTMTFNGLTVGVNNTQSGSRFANMECQELIFFNTSHAAAQSAADLAARRTAWRF